MMAARRQRHFLAIADLSIEELRDLIDLALELKRRWLSGERDRPLEGRILAMVFERPSLRTRASFEVGMLHLGGHAMYLAPQEVELGRRETVPDAARVLSRYVDAIMIRTGAHERVTELARYATVPVINGLSLVEHPCQALADVLTLRERFGALAGLRVAYVGDGNNVARSLIEAAALTGIDLRLACPPGYEPDLAERVDDDPRVAVAGARAVYTDVWVSMGDEAGDRVRDLSAYRVTPDLMALAAPDAIFLHCLPAHRGQEVDAAVIDGGQTAVWQQAANRLPTEQAALYALVTGDWEV